MVFLLLIAIGVAGRWGQPQWSVTPLAAAALFAGYYFTQRWVALLVPLVILTISNLALPQYDSLPVMFSVYLAMVIPVALGELLRRFHSWPALAVAGPLAVLVPSTAFYLLTNFAVWAFENHYPHTLTGLAECYGAGVPFYRWMAAGDVVYTAILFGCYAVARLSERRSADFMR
jgi:hypothetical protein